MVVVFLLKKRRFTLRQHLSYSVFVVPLYTQFSRFSIKMLLIHSAFKYVDLIFFGFHNRQVSRNVVTCWWECILGQLQQGLILPPQWALREIVCPIDLEQLAVSRVVICDGEGGQGLPEVFWKSEMLRGRVLELGEFHFILQDNQSVSLNQTYD